MPDRAAAYLARALCLVLALCALSLAPARLQAQQLIEHELRSRLRDFDRMLTPLPDSSQQADALIAQSGLTEVMPALTALPTIAPLPVTTTDLNALAPVRSRIFDIRLALARIAQIYGARDNLDVERAGATRDNLGLVIDSGTVSIADIFELLAQSGMQTDRGAGRNLLRVPVVIWDTATLRMTPGEELALSRPDGAFIVNFGRLHMDGARLSVDGGASLASPDFIPFVANSAGATVRVRNSQFSDLGFGTEEKFSGFSVVRNPLLSRSDEVMVAGNTFTNLSSVSFSLADGAVFQNNRIHNTRSASLTIVQSRNVQILGNLITGDAFTNAIRLFQGSSDAVVEGNVILNGDRAGITARSDSNRLSVRNNVVWKRGGGGISLGGVRCALVEGNAVMDNGQKGVEVRGATGIRVIANVIAGNHSPGIYISAQGPQDVTLIAGNTLIGNGSGIGAATGGRLALEGNDLTRQFPQFVSGDLTSQGRVLATNLRGDDALVLTPAGPEYGVLPPVSCNE